MVKSVLIVGGGQAALSCAAKLRELDNEATITMICAEAHLPYQRPPLSKKYATGDMTTDQLLLRPADWYAQNRIEVLTSTQATRIDRKSNGVELSTGQSMSYDALVLATGSRPRNLPAKVGGDLPGVYLLRGIDDADALAREFGGEKKALIVGGGYIGLEAAAVLSAQGMQVTVVEMADRILQRVASPQTSNYFRALHEDHGVRILEKTGLNQLMKKDDSVSSAELTSGETIDMDFVLVGIGIIANDDLAEEAGLLVDNGIVVDEFGQTSDRFVFAAGDCANFPYLGERLRLESVQNAIDQAENVAQNIAGQAVPYHPYPWFWSDQYDVKLQIAGLNRGYDKTVVRKGTRQGSQSVWYFKNRSLISVDAMNDPRAYMVAKKVLESGITVTAEQIGDQTLDLKSLLD